MEKAMRFAVAALACVGATAGCNVEADPEARIELVSAPTLSPLIFHGNCEAGWMMRATVRVTASEGSVFVVRDMEYRFTDGAASEGEWLDAAALRDRFGAGADTINGSRDYALGIRWPNGSTRRVTVSARVSGVDNLAPVSAIRLENLEVTTLTQDPNPPGACSPGFQAQASRP